MATKSFNRRFHGRCGGKFSFFRNSFVFVILWLVVAAGIGAIVMLLWNWLMPVIFGLPALSLWQALGLLVLMRILFGSFGFGRRGGRPGGGMPGMSGRGMNPVREKWMKMTPEQRKEFINKRKKMGFGPWGRDDFFNRGDFGMDKDFEMDENVDSSKKDE